MPSTSIASLRQQPVCAAIWLALGVLGMGQAFAQTPAPAASAPALAPSPARISDQAIGQDRAAYEQLEAELRKRHAAGASVAQAQLAKAQCWLDVSFHEYSRNERDAFPQEALAQAQGLLAAFDRDPQASLAPTPLIAGAQRIREDLWKRAGASSGKQQCALARSACAEVALVHAGHEDAVYGWRSARPYVGIAEDAVSSASAYADECSAALSPAAVQAPAVVAAVPGVAQPTVVPVAPLRRRIALATDTLFAYDKSEILLASGNKGQGWKAVVPQIRREFEKIESVKILGYTDRMGSDNHNDPLSWRRAMAVVAALKAEGLTEVGMEAYGMGSRDPKVFCKGERRTPALKQCLQPNRRVEIEVTGWPR